MPAGPMRDRKEGLAPEMGARVAGDGEAIDAFRLEAAERQASANRFRWKSRAVLDATESLFFDRRDEPAGGDQGRGDVAVIGVDTQNVHRHDKDLGASARAAQQAR